MKKSVRAIRMERHHKRMSQTSKLSLVSLMDIFTILVFFLIVNASNVEVLEAHKSVKLPVSVSEQPAEQRLLVMLTPEQVIVQGEAVALLAEMVADEQGEAPKLMAALQAQRALLSEQQLQADSSKQITIMADKALPYKTLKVILTSCAHAGYTDIALTVEGQQPDNSAEGV